MVMEEILPFKEKLSKRVNIPVRFHTEVLTTAQARRACGPETFLDARAAAIMLQSFLDSGQYQL
jgi:RNase H-fold protein (predicted Holliday junction resolvase)